MTYIPIKDGVISTNNSTSSTLTASGVFTGLSDDTKGYTAITVFATSDEDGHLIILQSTDGTNFDKLTRYNFSPKNQIYIDSTIALSCRYVKVTYTNGATGQTSFRLATTYHTNKDSKDEAQTVNFERGSQDGFQRLITCEPHTFVDVHRVLGLNSRKLINYSPNASATIVHQTDAASAVLNILAGAGSSARATSRSRARIVYQPSKVVDTIMTGVLALSSFADSNTVISRIGLFDENSGVFVAHTNGTDYIAHRTRVSGSVVDTLVASTDWNGPCTNFTLDTSKANIYNFRHAWLGVSSIQVSILAHGNLHILHTFSFENTQTTPFQLTGSLPLTWEIQANAAVPGAFSMGALCGSISSLAGATPNGVSFAIGDGVTGKTVTATETPLIAIAIDATDYKLECVQAVMNHLSVICTTNANFMIRVRLYHDVADTTALTGVSWVSMGNETGVKYDITSTAIASTTSSTTLVASFFTASIDSISLPTNDSARITYNQLDALSDILVVTAQRIGSGTETCYSNIDMVSYI